MSELDLIPASWRARRRARGALARVALAYAILALVLGAAKITLGLRIEAEAAELDRLRGDRHSVASERARLDALQAREALLSRELGTLRKLGGAADVARVFAAVEETLASEVWFRDWVFMRAGEYVDVGPKTVETGYLILVPDAGSGERKRAWRMHTHMEIRGQALSHSALADFVRRLAATPMVHEVKILDTRSQRLSGTEVVDFELAVEVREPGQRA